MATAMDMARSGVKPNRFLMKNPEVGQKNNCTKGFAIEPRGARVHASAHSRSERRQPSECMDPLRDPSTNRTAEDIERTTTHRTEAKDYWIPVICFC